MDMLHQINEVHLQWNITELKAVTDLLCSPSKKEGHIALHMSVGRYVGLP